MTRNSGCAAGTATAALVSGIAISDGRARGDRRADTPACRHCGLGRHRARLRGLSGTGEGPRVGAQDSQHIRGDDCGFVGGRFC